jgi:GT2 family glycosyltransferase
MNQVLARADESGSRRCAIERNESSSCSNPLATVVISTKNRCDDLRRALSSVSFQTIPLEVLVMDDGSTDGTAGMVRAEFPAALLVRSEISRGYIAERNLAAKLATTPYLFSIDDDAEFSSPQVIERTIADFADARIGAVAIPYVEPHKGNRLLQRAPSPDSIWVTDAFVGTAHAVRTDVFRRLGGYRELLVHQGEERDFCIRMLAAGQVVRLGEAPPIIHYESPRRDFRRMDYYGRRNDILFAWHNVPRRRLPLHLIGTAFNGMRSACAAGRFSSMGFGMFAGVIRCLQQWSQRAPVSCDVYQMSRQLRKSGPLCIERVIRDGLSTVADAGGRRRD